ncbi:hypothetical protein DB42_BL00110 [Neochlamydia sp. EPS4]|uniref:hypothetical protein n=1 Tax=Neochlamydia sp. EPS4 TaxID=1478175 RepID=UPI0005830C00|nr:hypothetical protein [Neochlamydia sp. EPS4]KIC74086.1 hypothetical protein DB42_BL00110 [Neochlamydia sp. EPS4]
MDAGWNSPRTEQNHELTNKPTQLEGKEGKGQARGRGSIDLSSTDQRASHIAQSALPVTEQSDSRNVKSKRSRWDQPQPSHTQTKGGELPGPTKKSRQDVHAPLVGAKEVGARAEEVATKALSLRLAGSIRFSHPYVSPVMDNGKITIEDFKEKVVKKNRWDPALPIEVVRMPDQELTSFDNRRLTALRQAAEEKIGEEDTASLEEIKFYVKILEHGSEANPDLLRRIDSMWGQHVQKNDRAKVEKEIAAAAAANRIKEGSIGYAMITRVHQYNSLIARTEKVGQRNVLGYSEPPEINDDAHYKEKGKHRTMKRRIGASPSPAVTHKTSDLRNPPRPSQQAIKKKEIEDAAYLAELLKEMEEEHKGP